MGRPRRLGKGRGVAAKRGKGKGKKKGRRAGTGAAHRTGSNTVSVDWVNPIATSAPVESTPQTARELVALEAVADSRARATSQQQGQLQRLDQLMQQERRQLQLLRDTSKAARTAADTRAGSAERASGRGSRRSSSSSAIATVVSRGRSLTRKTAADGLLSKAAPLTRSRSAARPCRHDGELGSTATVVPWREASQSAPRRSKWGKTSRLGLRMQEVTQKRQSRRKNARQEATSQVDRCHSPQSKTSDLAIAQRLEREQLDQQRQQQLQQPSLDPERPIPPAVFGKAIFGGSGTDAKQTFAQIAERNAAEAKLAACRVKVELAAKQGQERDALKLEEQEDQRRQMRTRSATPRAPPWAQPPWLKVARAPAATTATAAAASATAAAEEAQDPVFQEMAKEEAAAQLRRLADSNVHEAALANAVARRIRTYANIATAVTTSPFARVEERAKASSRAAPWTKSGGPPQSWQGANSSTWR